MNNKNKEFLQINIKKSPNIQYLQSNMKRINVHKKQHDSMISDNLPNINIVNIKNNFNKDKKLFSNPYLFKLCHINSIPRQVDYSLPSISNAILKTNPNEKIKNILNLPIMKTSMNYETSTNTHISRSNKLKHSNKPNYHENNNFIRKLNNELHRISPVSINIPENTLKNNKVMKSLEEYKLNLSKLPKDFYKILKNDRIDDLAEKLINY